MVESDRQSDHLPFCGRRTQHSGVKAVSHIQPKEKAASQSVCFNEAAAHCKRKVESKRVYAGVRESEIQPPCARAQLAGLSDSLSLMHTIACFILTCIVRRPR